MFELGFGELFVILIVALIVLGPEKLPGFARFIAGVISKIRGFNQTIKNELARGAEAAQLNQLSETLKNNARDLRAEVQAELAALNAAPKKSAGEEDFSLPSEAPFTREENYSMASRAQFSTLHKKWQDKKRATLRRWIKSSSPKSLRKNNGGQS